jgi:hypothetical protein
MARERPPNVPTSLDEGEGDGQIELPPILSGESKSFLGLIGDGNEPASDGRHLFASHR